MTRPPLPPLAVALAHLRSIASWSREELGHGHGLASKTIAEFEAGHRTLSRARAEQLVATLGFGPEMLDEVLADVERRRGEVSPEGSIPLPPAERRALARSQRDLSAYLAAELGRLRRLERAREERAAAGALFERLAGFTSIQRCRAVEGAEKYLSWALALRLAEESAKAAPDSAARALEYAELGLRVAERVAGAECLVPPAFGLLLRGQAWAFLANARRVAGNLPGADEGLARCDQLWEEGEGGDPDGLIDPSRRFDLKASLRKHQGRLDEALVALDQALATGLRGEAAGRVLLKKAFALEQCGQPETALATLSQAELYLDASAEPRLVCVLRFNQAVNLCHLGRFTEAAAQLPSVRALAIQLRNGLDLVRVLWLEARALAGLGHAEEAEATLDQVRRDLADRSIAYDAALASLELAALRLERGHASEARRLTQDLAPLFRAQRVPRDLLAALRLFVEALEAERATANTARELLRRLEREGLSGPVGREAEP